MSSRRITSIVSVIVGVVLVGVMILVVSRPTGGGHDAHGAPAGAATPADASADGITADGVTGAHGAEHATDPDQAPSAAPADLSSSDEVDHSQAHPEVRVAVPGAYEATREAVLTVLDTDGQAAALAELDRLITTDPSVSGVCHAVAHDLGHAALDRAGGDAAKALSDRDDVCGGGYTHGIIEKALGDSTNVKRDLLRICAPRQDGSCFHGVGHGLMFATDMNPRKSLRLCDLSPDFTLAHRCAEGVYMQLFSGDIAAAHAAGAALPSLVDARDECETTRETYQANCWFYSPNVWLAEHPDDFLGAMDWCRGASTDLGRASCIRGTGSRAVKYHPDDLSVAEEVCAEAGANRPDCVGGMASYWSVHWKGEVPRSDLCDRLDKRRLAKVCRQVT